MIKVYTIFCLFFISISAHFGQNCSFTGNVFDLGIGIVKSENEDSGNTYLEIYNDSSLKNLFIKWDLFREKPNKNICAFFHKPDYGIAYVICLEVKGEYFKVIINYDEIKFIPNNGNYKFIDWESFLIDQLPIRRRYDLDSSGRNQPLYEINSISSNRKSIQYSPYEQFCIIDMESDWIKVVYNCPEHEKSCKEITKKCSDQPMGWLKWRNKNNILIDIALLL